MDISPIEKRIAAINRTIDRPIIFVTGPSGSGKTTLARQLATATAGACLSFDWWIKDDSNTRRQKIIADYKRTGDIPNPLTWYDWDSLIAQLLSLQATGELRLNNAWDQSSGEKNLSISINSAHGPIVVEGVYLFEPYVRELANLIILIQSDMERSTLAALQRQAHRNPNEYLKIKKLWYIGFDKPYFDSHIEDADIIFKGWTA